MFAVVFRLEDLARSPAMSSEIPRVSALLYKTDLCSKYPWCIPGCPFAHSVHELRARPDLSKTRWCKAFRKGLCRDQDCAFAHARRELRRTAGLYKTALCRFHSRGHCVKGDECCHAHGVSDLRMSSVAYKQCDGMSYFVV